MVLGRPHGFRLLQNTSEYSTATKPMSNRMTPREFTLTPGTSVSTANARMAPSTISKMPTPMPILHRPIQPPMAKLPCQIRHAPRCTTPNRPRTSRSRTWPCVPSMRGSSNHAGGRVWGGRPRVGGPARRRLMVGASGSAKERSMNTGLLIAILVIVVVVVLVAVLLGQRRRTQRLQQQFGPEYQRTVARSGDQRTAEADLTAREQRRREFDIVVLEPAVRDRYLETWRATQGRFVDDPAAATREADALVAQVMRDRGYPVDDFDQQAADVSVDHPQVAEHDRAGRAVAATGGPPMARWTTRRSPRTTAPPTPSSRPTSRGWPAPTTCDRR